ncbi:hypothetical protein T440DRAFT_471038 [Plenodomus tracheiphilus IPT5]|uniref:Uncharacterized protein n=1 Tax=Plenodomus tracheiphilus IPT5 TaxID=1408161 RepID=A0A6A7AXI6_9PLEO|nr:hypothetical protein T440DRAFT_471038 [Plenodomus tracheiphilus IPT5]
MNAGDDDRSNIPLWTPYGWTAPITMTYSNVACPVACDPVSSSAQIESSTPSILNTPTPKPGTTTTTNVGSTPSPDPFEEPKVPQDILPTPNEVTVTPQPSQYTSSRSKSSQQPTPTPSGRSDIEFEEPSVPQRSPNPSSAGLVDEGIPESRFTPRSSSMSSSLNTPQADAQATPQPTPASSSILVVVASPSASPSATPAVSTPVAIPTTGRPSTCAGATDDLFTLNSNHWLVYCGRQGTGTPSLLDTSEQDSFLACLEYCTADRSCGAVQWAEATNGAPSSTCTRYIRLDAPNDNSPDMSGKFDVAFKAMEG